MKPGLLLPPLAAILAGCTAGCQTMPETFAPPQQRKPLEDYRPYRATRIINMIDSDAEAHFVRDIDGALVANWRWGKKRPTVWLRPRSNDNVRYLIEFALPEVTFKDTGPVIISFYVGDHLLETARYTDAGQHRFEKPVPREWLVPGEEVHLSAEIDKLWTSPQDGATFGFVLTSIGLTQP